MRLASVTGCGGFTATIATASSPLSVDPTPIAFELAALVAVAALASADKPGIGDLLRGAVGGMVVAATTILLLSVARLSKQERSVNDDFVVLLRAP